MTLPAAYAPISLGQIQSEFGGSNPAALSEYYRGKLWSFYRYYSNNFGNHFYTATPSGEYLTQNAYVLQNPNYFLAYKDNISGTTALYRVFDDNADFANKHLLTIDISEYNTVIGQGWNDEGIVGYVYSSSVANSQPVYRWRKNDNSDYLFTTSGDETPANYTYEGIAFYALQFGAAAYVSDNNTNVPTSGTIALSNFYSAWLGVVVSMGYSRDANNQNYFYLSANGFPTVTLTAPSNGSFSIDAYIAPNVTYTITSNTGNIIQGYEVSGYDDDNNPISTYPLNEMWLEDSDDADYNDLRWYPSQGEIFDNGGGNFYYVLNI